MNDKMLIRTKTETELKNWRAHEKMALELIRVVGELRFDHSIELVLFRRVIYDTRPSEVIEHHSFATNYINQPISVENTLELAKAIYKMNLAPSKIDIGKLCAEWVSEGSNFGSMDEFLNDKIGSFKAAKGGNLDSKDVVLYGFGRIGRLAARRIVSSTGRGEQLRLKAIVIRPKMDDRHVEALKRAALFEEDSVHGKFRGTVKVEEDGNVMNINGNRIQLIYAKAPTDIDYTIYGIADAMVIDNTGVWRDKEALAIHMRPGVSQVMLTAPAKGVPNIVYGVNEGDMDVEQDKIFCAASCTTNAIAPVLQVMDESFGITKGHIETIHAYTNDQNLLDNFHKKPRRGKGAATNMVLTTTGAAKAVALVLPHLAGILTGNAVRVPTPDVSLAVINLSLKKATSPEEINKKFKHASLYGKLVEQIHYSGSTEFSSSTAVGQTTTSVIDTPSTIVSHDGTTATIYAWYDNEYGYTCQVIRLAKHAAKVRRNTYY